MPQGAQQASQGKENGEVVVVCVLRSGGIYDATWVAKLSKGVARHITIPYRFICLTDMEHEVEAAGVESFTLPDLWPGWWAKISLWNPRAGLTGRTLYLDLDCIVTGPLDGMVRHTPGLTMCRDFYGRGHNSSVMSWCGDLRAIHRAFATNPEVGVGDYTRRKDGRIGDQAFIEDQIEPDTFPAGDVVSYKADAREGIPAGAKVVAFHGRPKPHEAGGWVKWN